MAYVKKKFAVILFIFLVLNFPMNSKAEKSPEAIREDTMLMFVGECLEVLSIASRREESARQAPAIAQVITKEEIREKGMTTLSETLEMVPGFYMAQKEWGTLPYLRGIPNSVLFLYDTVPLDSDTSKSIHQLDHELSLASVKRVEIIRGPGSVLWGPDAFAGIVNVVPLTGKDFEGIETGVSYEEPGDHKACFVNMGHDAGLWDGFLSVSARRGNEDDSTANLVRYWKDMEIPVAPEDRFGRERPDHSKYVEVTGRFSYNDWLTLTARTSYNQKSYAMTNSDGNLTWLESRELPFSFFKLEGVRNIDPTSAVRFTGYYSYFDPEFEIIERTFDQNEDTVYGELIYDRSFLAGRGLFTGGGSFRKKDIEDALVWEDYLPELLGSENEDFLPRIREEDYDSELWSVFGQYTHKFGDMDIWFGLRQDFHHPYEDRLSFSTGASWSLSDDWIIKLLYGTAYRTPFARQLIEEKEPELEKIKSLSCQIAWEPSQKINLSVAGFTSRIEDHIMEDPYAGLSQRNHQDIQGVEIEGRWKPVKQVEFSSNLTLLNNDGPDETYHFSDYTYVRPDGTVAEHFVDLEYPFDTGPDTIFNLMGTWRPSDRFTAFVRANYFSSRKLIFPRGEGSLRVSGVWRLDVSTTLKDVFNTGLDLNVAVRNFADHNFETPGTYHTIEGEPFSVEVMLKKCW
jgi:outer membrane receptor for ferrienterochelin and colicin